MPKDRPRTAVEDLDLIRALVFQTITELPGVSVAGAGRACGRGPSYISDYLWYGSPDELPERERGRLAKYLDLNERQLRPPGLLSEPGTGYDQPPPTAPKEAPVAPYEAPDLMGDLLPALDRLHREERWELSLDELGVAAWHLHQEIMAAGGDLHARLEKALRARRRHLRKNRADSLRGMVPRRGRGRG